MLERVDGVGAPAPEAGVPSMTLGSYLAEAGKALRTSLPRAWVEAVVLEAKPTKFGLALELIEPDAAHDPRRTGRLRTTLWSRTASAIEGSLGLPLDAPTLRGAQVRLLVKTTFDPKWHLEGEVLDLDPAMVQGLVARQLELIRQALRAERLWGAQQRLAEPGDITTLAVIHPDRAAGWADVRAELERLQARGILRVASHPAPFEGKGAAGGIADALAAIAAGPHPDLVLIVRGGGAASGFTALANLGLARALCRCPVPVVTGIGHASDRTILDEVAWRAADTPSKALGVVKSILRQRCRAAVDDHRAIVGTAASLLGSSHQPLLAAARDAVVAAAARMTARQDALLRELAYGVERHIVAVRESLAVSQAELDRLAASLVDTAPALPRRAATGLATLYAGIARATGARLPGRDALPGEARRSAGAVTAFVERQANELAAALARLESAMRRRLDDEARRLTALGHATEALGLDSTLARGFVLPLDGKGLIVRTAEAARGADALELVFIDGSVPCRPTA